jgi:hypothetical protein
MSDKNEKTPSDATEAPHADKASHKPADVADIDDSAIETVRGGVYRPGTWIGPGFPTNMKSPFEEDLG